MSSYREKKRNKPKQKCILILFIFVSWKTKLQFSQKLNVLLLHVSLALSLWKLVGYYPFLKFCFYVLSVVNAQ